MSVTNEDEPTYYLVNWTDSSLLCYLFSAARDFPKQLSQSISGARTSLFFNSLSSSNQFQRSNEPNATKPSPRKHPLPLKLKEAKRKKVQ